MKVKLDKFYIGVLINGLFQRRDCYGAESKVIISDLLLRLVNTSETMKLSRKKKLLFEPVEVDLIHRSLLDWRNEQIQADKDVAVKVIGELLEKML